MTAQYGLDINSLDKLIAKPRRAKKSWGYLTKVVSVPEYELSVAEIDRGKKCALVPVGNFETTFYVEHGEIALGKTKVPEKSLVTVAPGESIECTAKKQSRVYFFSGPADSKGRYGTAFAPTDHRDKYWGEIETLVSSAGYSAKRMVVKKGAYASLEFHCNKFESYYIQSGKLLLRLRAGRGEDRFFELGEGVSNTIPQGLMHQRGGLEDTVIIEIATKDEDSDSYLVEDGARMKMPQLASRLAGEKKLRGKRISFDLDGVICTNTEGDYAKAKPIKEAIAIVNKLYDEGHQINLFTARFMGRHKNDWKSAYEEGYMFTKKQLESWGVKFHELFLGKPSSDIFIDDRALFFTPDWKLLETEIRAMIDR
ncbi:MAG: hypothetical protein V4674_01540 [Patescibacteria group bacterium]